MPTNDTPDQQPQPKHTAADFRPELYQTPISVRLAANTRKFRPATRTERLANWNRRMQSLFTRQSY